MDRNVWPVDRLVSSLGLRLPLAQSHLQAVPQAEETESSMTADPTKSLRQKAEESAAEAFPLPWDDRYRMLVNRTNYVDAFEAGYRQGIEEAAQLADASADWWSQFERVSTRSVHAAASALDLAKRVRALLPPSERTEEQEGGSA
jgi:hypothetical protein